MPRSSSNKSSHLRALLKKNWILWKRNWCWSAMEILLPLLYNILILYQRSITPIVTVPQSTFSLSDWTYVDEKLDFWEIMALDPYKLIGLAPAEDDIVLQLDEIFRQANLTTRIFQNNAQIDEFTSSPDYDSDLYLAIVITKNNIDNKYEYLLRFNASLLGKDIPNTNAQRLKPLSMEDLDSLNKYLNSGFLTVQNLIDNLILQKETGSLSSAIRTAVGPKTVGAYLKDYFSINMQNLRGLMFVESELILPSARFINGIIREKEKRTREGMKMMGIANSTFYLAWFITYFIIFTVISILVSVMLSFGAFNLSGMGWIFLWHWEYCMCLMALGFLISIFLKKIRYGNIVASLVFIYPAILMQLTQIEEDIIKPFPISILPQVSFHLYFKHIANLEFAQVGLTAETVTLEVLEYRMIFYYFLMFFETIILLLLGSYLDQILPNEFGIRKHPLFCLKRKKQAPRDAAYNIDSEENRSIMENPQNYEDTPPNLKAQDLSGESIQIKSIRKVFSKGKVAVDGVSFSMYKDQIFALLGHNGAGKTTLISLLTGLFNPSEGTASIFGIDIQHKPNDAKKVVGVCPQFDVFFDNLTVRENLEVFAMLKGGSSKSQINKVMKEIGLSEKKNCISENLSRSEKRKLSVGLAFLGDSKFILLDDPSFGMDIAAKRKLWEMLKNYKNNRAILLTTHSMDEADYLGDRIGIMAEGKLKCLGSPLFLKVRFVGGYNLKVVKTDLNVQNKPIIDIIKHHFSDFKVLAPVDSSLEMEFQLPLQDSSKFKDLCISLDSKLEKYGISSYGVSTTTFDEVFLKVAEMTALERNPQNRLVSVSLPEDEAPVERFDLRKERIKNPCKLFWIQFMALFVKRYHYTKRNKQGLVCGLLFPILIVIVGFLAAEIDFFKDPIPLPLTDDLYGYKFVVNSSVAFPEGYSFLYSTFASYFNSDFLDLQFTPASSILTFNEPVFSSQGNDMIDSHVNVFKFYMEIPNSTANIYEYIAIVDSRAREGAPFALNKVNNAILKYATKNREKSIQVVVSPFQKTKSEEFWENTIDGSSYIVIFSLCMGLVTANVTTFIIKERKTNAKNQQYVCGVSIAAYWLSNYFFDVIKYMIPGVFCCLIPIVFEVNTLIEGEKLPALWAFFISYGFSIVSFVYLTSFLFRDERTAEAVCLYSCFLIGYILVYVVFYLQIMNLITHEAAETIQSILRVIPYFVIVNRFTSGSLSSNLLSLTKIGATEEEEATEKFSMKLVGGDILYLWGTAVAFLAIVFMIEVLATKYHRVGILIRKKKIPKEPKGLDVDVQKEMKEIKESDNKTYAIKVDKLRKVYFGFRKPKVAVNQLSFGVKNAECFALLGVNGAGKTTTFKILSGEYAQTSGKAFINGYDIPAKLKRARYDIGYCPQTDTLLENLTAKEHLFLYASIKGIPKKLRTKLVEKQLIEMNLKEYANIPAGTYDLKNQRKLSLAIALIGNPSVVILDDPLTGMDPETRKYMRSLISKERKHSSIILTTYSMEEAEELATRIGIMGSGNLKCLGTSQHIKSRYGGGHEIEVKLNLPSEETVNILIEPYNSGGDRIRIYQVDQILAKADALDLRSEISETGAGSAFYFELEKGNISARVFAEWVLIEKRRQRLIVDPC